MRLFAPRPILLALTLVLVAGAIVFIEFRLDAGASSSAAGSQAESQPANPQPTRKAGGRMATADEGGEKVVPESSKDTEKPASPKRAEDEMQELAISDTKRISRKEAEYTRAEEIKDSFGFINTDGISIEEATGEKVILVEFWTYTCYNCQNAQPHINALH